MPPLTSIVRLLHELRLKHVEQTFFSQRKYIKTSQEKKDFCQPFHPLIALSASDYTGVQEGRVVGHKDINTQQHSSISV